MIDRRLGSEDRKNRFEERWINHLPAGSADWIAAVARPQRRDDREGAVRAGDHLGKHQRRERRFTVGKAGTVRKAAHGLPKGSQSGRRRIRAGLAEAGYPHHDDLSIGGERNLWSNTHLFDGTGTIILMNTSAVEARRRRAASASACRLHD